MTRHATWILTCPLPIICNYDIDSKTNLKWVQARALGSIQVAIYAHTNDDYSLKCCYESYFLSLLMLQFNDNFKS